LLRDFSTDISDDDAEFFVEIKVLYNFSFLFDAISNVDVCLFCKFTGVLKPDSISEQTSTSNKLPSLSDSFNCICASVLSKSESLPSSDPI